MSRDQYADRYTTLRWPYQSQAVRYVRSITGDDDNDGLTELTAWQTLDKGLTSYAIAGVNHQWVLDLGSGDGTVAVFAGADRTLNLGGTMLGGINFSLDFGATGPDNFFSHSHCQFRSAPLPVGAIGPLTITGSVANATTGLRTITVTQNLVVNAHVGQLLLGEGLGEWARIVSNTLHDLVITTSVNPTTWTTSVQIYTEGTILRYGDPVETFEEAVYLMNFSDWQFTGIAFESTANAKLDAISVYARAPVTFTMCSFAGISLWDGPGQIFLDACYAHDFFYGHNGAEATWRNSFLNALAPAFHGSSDSGTNEFSECVFRAWLNAIGRGNTATRWSGRLDKCEVSGSMGDGVEFGFGNGVVTNCDIHNNAGIGIFTQKHAWVLMNNVVGVANGTYGLKMESGSQVDVTAACTVTGATGNVKVGAIAAAHVWGAGAVTDVGEAIPEFCRLYGPNA